MRKGFLKRSKTKLPWLANSLTFAAAVFKIVPRRAVLPDGVVVNSDEAFSNFLVNSPKDLRHLKAIMGRCVNYSSAQSLIVLATSQVHLSSPEQQCAVIKNLILLLSLVGNELVELSQPAAKPLPAGLLRNK